MLEVSTSVTRPATPTIEMAGCYRIEIFVAQFIQDDLKKKRVK